jgi:hypothetical protein
MIGIRDKNFSDFNKEIFFGEAGAILGAALISTIASHFTDSGKIIAQFAVLGSIIGGSSLFLLKKIRNKIRRKEPILKSILRDLEYFTPAAAVIGFGICYPTLYSVAKFLVKMGWHTYLAGAVAEVCAFSVFIILVNLYRVGLIKWFKKNLS